jgi:hypothetical protein
MTPSKGKASRMDEEGEASVLVDYCVVDTMSR